jgi:deoxycytidylate deaminase
MSEPLPVSIAPELFFGLVAPIGVDLDLVTNALDRSLQEMDYKAREFRLTKLMKEVPTGLSLAPDPYIQSYRDRIAYANEVRRLLGDDALACLAISAIRSFRADERKERYAEKGDEQDSRDEPDSDESVEEAPLSKQAYIIRQIKRPEEVALLRSVYGRQFILVSAYAPQEARKRRIEALERRSRGGLISDVDASSRAHELVAQDAKESLDKHGQNVRDAFPLGDVFIDASRGSCEVMVRRFVDLLFGSNEVTPTHDEYGMYIAKSASLRSSDLSRQVGAAIFRTSGEVVTLGCNEVPKAGGGTYWSEEPGDSRDFVEGHDPNELRKFEVLVDVLDRLRKGGHLSAELMNITDSQKIGELLLIDKAETSVSESRIMDILEFGRTIHAEMSAICDASRKGISVEKGTLYCTTFPCHICAKHIVAAGLLRVVYLEPYPKSYAFELHQDSIVVDYDGSSDKVKFDAFIGVSPYRYRDLFEKGKRKYSSGLAQKWSQGKKRPMIEVYYPSYFKAETRVVGLMRRRLEEILASQQLSVALPAPSEKPLSADGG